MTCMYTVSQTVNNQEEAWWCIVVRRRSRLDGARLPLVLRNDLRMLYEWTAEYSVRHLSAVVLSRDDQMTIRQGPNERQRRRQTVLKVELGNHLLSWA